MDRACVHDDPVIRASDTLRLAGDHDRCSVIAVRGLGSGACSQHRDRQGDDVGAGERLRAQLAGHEADQACIIQGRIRGSCVQPPGASHGFWLSLRGGGCRCRGGWLSGKSCGGRIEVQPAIDVAEQPT